MAAVVNIFRLLPHPAASQFLEGLVTLVVSVETQLKKDGSTPFTKPLAGFLNRYPIEACDFYFPRLITDDHYARNLCAVLGSDDAPALRAYITQYSRTLLVPAFEQELPPPPGPDGSVAAPPYKTALHAAQVMQAMIAKDPSWIVSNHHMIDPMIQRWISQRRYVYSSLP
jgi:transformation/transcription domain-associated protein